MLNHQPVTMETVARKAGVSRSTVSRALRNHPAIPLPTRQRIKTLADQLGYRPNPFVAALMSQLQGTSRKQVAPIIALISAFPIETGWRMNPSVTRMVEGVLLHSQQLGYRLETFCLAENRMTPERLSRILDSRCIQGVIILPTPKSRARINLAWAKFSAVALGYSLEKPKLHRVCNHLAHTMTKVLDHVINCGHRRIGLAMQADTDARVDHSWRSRYLLYIDMHPEIDFVPMLLTPVWNRDSFGIWFQKTKPEVVVTDDPHVQDWLEEMGCSVPSKVNLVLLDCTRSCSSCAGIDQHHEIMGAAAVDLVVELLHKNETGVPIHPKTVMIEGTWMDGLTLVRNGKADPGPPVRLPPSER